MTHRICRLLPFVALTIVLALGCGASLGGCTTSASADWAQTAPPIAPVAAGGGMISVQPWDRNDPAAELVGAVASE